MPILLFSTWKVWRKCAYTIGFLTAGGWFFSIHAPQLPTDRSKAILGFATPQLHFSTLSMTSFRIFRIDLRWPIWMTYLKFLRTLKNIVSNFAWFWLVWEKINCTLNWKCEFKKTEIQFLGNIISPGGLRMDPRKGASYFRLAYSQ